MNEEKSTVTVEERLTAIETIIKKLESGEPDLQESLALFEEGVRLVRESGAVLSEAETRLKILTDQGVTDEF
ncbi:MAG: exodeoxyribonuclease VII small subunit [Lachnospiraceae bacterium]|nr:exodeoxyribonuclease VII small subunit [Lachnospiraceae bacterium]MBP5254347.1 exodeoxyribonuclease VII small subunit [Lachnospiraceae bacterium]